MFHPIPSLCFALAGAIIWYWNSQASRTKIGRYFCLGMSILSLLFTAIWFFVIVMKVK